MATKEVGTRLVVEGVSSFKQQMNEAAGAIKVLNAESKAIQAEYKATGNEQQYLEKTYANLTNKMKLQKEQIETARRALEQLSEKGFKPNSQEVQRWQSDLAKAQAGMYETQASITETVARVHELGGTFVETGGTAQEAAGQLSHVGDRFSTSGATQSATEVSEGVQEASSTAEETKEKVATVGGKFATDDVKDSADDVAGKVEDAAGTADDTKAKIAGVGGEFSTGGVEGSSEDVASAVEGAAETADATMSTIAGVGGEFSTGGVEASAGDVASKVEGAAGTADDAAAKIAGTGGEFSTEGATSSAGDVGAAATAAGEAAAEARPQIEWLGASFDTGDATGSIDEVQEEANQLDGDAPHNELGKIGTAISISGIQTSLQNIERGITNVVNKAKQAGKALIDMAADSGQWADELVTTASRMGIDTTTLQQMQGASRYIDTDVETLQQASVKIRRSQDSKSWQESLGELNKASGADVQLVDEDGAKRSLDVLGEIIDALAQIDDYATREDLATKLLGSGADKFNPIIDAGGWAAYVEQMGKAHVVAEENVQALAAQDDAFQQAQAQMEVLKNTVMSKLAPAFQEGATQLAAFAEKLTAFVESDEGKEALTALSDAMTNLIAAFTSDDNMKTVFDAITAGVNALTSALEWFSNNGDTVVDIIKRIGEAFALIKVSETALTFMQLAQAAKNLLGGGGNTPTPTTAPTTAGGGGLGSMFARGAGALKTLGAKALPTLPMAGVFAAAGVGSYLTDKKYTQETYGGFWEEMGKMDETQSNWAEGTEELKNKIEEADTKLQEAKDSMVEMGQRGDEVRALQEQLNEQGFDVKVDGIVGEETFGAMKQNIERLEQELAEAETSLGEIDFRDRLQEMLNGAIELEDIDEEFRLDALKDYFANFGDELEQMFPDMDIWEIIKGKYGTTDVSMDDLFGADGLQAPNWDTFATQAVENLSKAMNGEIQLAQPEIAASVNEVASSASTEATPAFETGGTEGGSAFGQGAAEGIAAGEDSVRVAAAALATIAKNAFNEVLDIHSPSRVMERAGEFIARGIALGMDEGVTMVEAASQRLANAVSLPVAADSPRYSFGGGGKSGSGNVEIVMQLDGEEIGRAVAPVVDQELAVEVTRRR